MSKCKLGGSSARITACHIPPTPIFHVLPKRCLSFLFDTSVPALFDFPDLHQGDFDRLVFAFFHRLLRRDVIFTVTAMSDFEPQGASESTTHEVLS
jgi:hypothetical protein